MVIKYLAGIGRGSGTKMLAEISFSELFAIMGLEDGFRNSETINRIKGYLNDGVEIPIEIRHDSLIERLNTMSTVIDDLKGAIENYESVFGAHKE